MNNFWLDKEDEEKITWRRKHRWVLEIAGSSILVNIKSRPEQTMEEVVLTGEDGSEYVIPGRQKWSPLEFSYNDDCMSPEHIDKFYKWMADCTEYMKSSDHRDGWVNHAKSFKVPAKLILKRANEKYKADACNRIFGSPVHSSQYETLETLELKGCWPSEINFSCLDFTASELMEIDIKLQIDQCKTVYGE